MKMRIIVKAPAFLDLNCVDENGFVFLKDGSTLNDLYKSLKVKPLWRPFVLSTVNYERVALNTKLKEGDVVSFLALIWGG